MIRDDDFFGSILFATSSPTSASFSMTKLFESVLFIFSIPAGRHNLLRRLNASTNPCLCPYSERILIITSYILSLNYPGVWWSTFITVFFEPQQLFYILIFSHLSSTASWKATSILSNLNWTSCIPLHCIAWDFVFFLLINNNAIISVHQLSMLLHPFHHNMSFVFCFSFP